MSKSLSAVHVERKMDDREVGAFHIDKLGKRFGAWHKRNLLKVTSDTQAKFGVGRTYNVGSNDAKRARRYELEFVVSCCGRKLKNCRC